MMVMAALVVGLAAGKKLLRSSFYSQDFADKFLIPDHGAVQPTLASTKNTIIFAQQSSHFGMDPSTYRHTKPPIKALMTHADNLAPSATNTNTVEDHDDDVEDASLEALILLQKSMLEKQWELSFDFEKGGGKAGITRSGISAQQRRDDRRESLKYT